MVLPAGCNRRIVDGMNYFSAVKVNSNKGLGLFSQTTVEARACDTWCYIIMTTNTMDFDFKAQTSVMK